MTNYNPYHTHGYWWDPTDLYQDPLTTPNIRSKKITVVPVEGVYNTVLVTWDAVIGATGYNLYGSYSPTDSTIKVNTTPLSNTSYQVEVPMLTAGLQPYFWISSLAGTNETYVNSTGITFYNGDVFAERPLATETEDFYFWDLDETHYMIEEIRKRVMALMDTHGEQFDLYIRRLSGVPCDCTKEIPGIVGSTESVVPREYQGAQRCPDCFGTGIFGGYYKAIRIKATYVSRITDIAREQMGLRIKADSDFISLWAPQIKHRDIVVRGNGEKYILTGVNPSEAIRGQILSQIATYQLIESTDNLYTISDSAIDTAIAKAKLEENGFKIFA